MKLLTIFLFLGLSATVSYAATDKIFCYFGSWATYRNGNGKFDVEDIDAYKCSHIIYTFIGLAADGKVKILDSWNDVSLSALTRAVNLKKTNPSLKVMVAMGGWNEGSTIYSQVANSASLRSAMVNSVVSFCKQYGFDGFDLDWEYPALRGGAASDKSAFISLLQALRTRFDTEGLLLTAAVAAPASYIHTSYDVPKMNTYLHYINLMTYDFHGTWDGVTGQNAPLYVSSKESAGYSDLNVNAAVTAWISAGASASKLVVGTAAYGHTYTLSSTSNTNLGAPISGAGTGGPYTYSDGSLTYLEICEKLKAGGWTVVWDDEQKVPYAYKGNQWIGYDNARSIKIKAQYAVSMGLAGVMVWSIEQEDDKNVCGDGAYPLLTAINSVITSNSGGGGGGGGGGSTNTTTTSTTTAAPSTGLHCPPSGFVRDPNDCSVYYRCEYITSTATYKYTYFKCSSGLMFDNILNVCNWPSAVTC